VGRFDALVEQTTNSDRPRVDIVNCNNGWLDKSQPFWFIEGVRLCPKTTTASPETASFLQQAVLA
jgi:hypothetical protein